MHRSTLSIVREPGAQHRAGYIHWLLGAALLASVVVIALRASDLAQFAALLERARPAWLLIAVLLQAGTYLAQGSIWRAVANAGRTPVPASLLYRLSLAKLFVDQALPSAGLSGTIVLARALMARGVAESTVFAGVIVNMIGYHAAYVTCLAAALAIAASAGHASELIIAAWVLLALLGTALASAALVLSGHHSGWAPRWLLRLRPLKAALSAVNKADRTIARDPRIIVWALVANVLIMFLDTGTLWAALRSLGSLPELGRIFASFMIASLLRSMSFVPGGLGTFEAASVLTLKISGIPLPLALSSTLIFRLLTFWLPMLPGLAFSRAAAKLETPR